MPSEYTALVAALKATDIPFEEYGWKTRPEGTYGVVSLDFESGSENGDGKKLDRSWDAFVDVFYMALDDRETVIDTIETVLRSVCGGGWQLNSIQYETQTRLFHIEWTCEVMDNPEEGEPDGVLSGD